MNACPLMTENIAFELNHIGIDKNGDIIDARDGVCRDFIRNVCKRGQKCRFRHPQEKEAESLGKKDLVFCHDFQNHNCARPNCKFVHCTKQEEEIFRATGKLPDTVIESFSKAASCFNPDAPICKDYLKNECRRAGRCKFRHIQVSSNNINNEYELEKSMQAKRAHMESSPLDYYSYGPLAKRRPFDNSFNECTFIHERRGLESARCQILEEENALLLHKIEELKKQVVDLTATNEFLLDQNAQLRVSKHTLVSPISQTLIPHTLNPAISSLPPPTITQLSSIPSLPPPTITQLSSIPSLPPPTITQLSTIPSLPPTITQLSTIPSLPPPTITQLSTIPSLPPPTITQLSTIPLSNELGAASLAPEITIAPVSIAPQVTLPTISATPLSQSLPQTIITSTALISYPIMTQSMRPVIQHSLG